MTESQDLKLYAIMRLDLNMPFGKACAQAGHAYLNSFLAAPPQLQQEYQKEGIGTKICLGAKDLKELEKYLEKIQHLPHALIVDSGHVFLPYFTGDPIITALGVGPLTTDEARILRRLKLL